jgi:hypothetical protein
LVVFDVFEVSLVFAVLNFCQRRGSGLVNSFGL